MTLMGLWGSSEPVRLKRKSRKNTSYKRWTKEEDRFLIDNYATMRAESISEELDRSEAGIFHRAHILRRKGYVLENAYEWSNKDTVFLKSNYKKMNNQELADVMGKTYNSVQSKLTKMGLRRNRVRDYRPWSAEDEKFLILNYENLRASGVAKKVGRTIEAVMQRAKVLKDRGVSLRTPKKKWTEEEDSFLLENYHDMSINDLADSLERSYFSVYPRLRLLGLIKVKES